MRHKQKVPAKHCRSSSPPTPVHTHTHKKPNTHTLHNYNTFLYDLNGFYLLFSVIWMAVIFVCTADVDWCLFLTEIILNKLQINMTLSKDWQDLCRRRDQYLLYSSRRVTATANLSRTKWFVHEMCGKYKVCTPPAVTWIWCMCFWSLDCGRACVSKAARWR